MKNTIKLLCVIFSLLTIISFCGCVSTEAKNVISLIENLGEINIDSKAEIDAAIEAYNSLDEKDKKDVNNIEDLYSAQKEFEQCIPEYVSSKVNDYRFSKSIKYDELKQFVSDYV